MLARRFARKAPAQGVRSAITLCPNGSGQPIQGCALSCQPGYHPGAWQHVLGRGSYANGSPTRMWASMALGSWPVAATASADSRHGVQISKINRTVQATHGMSCVAPPQLRDTLMLRGWCGVGGHRLSVRRPRRLAM